MIVVTGATGKLGSAVVDHLLRLVSPSQIAVSVREAKGAKRFAERGVNVRLGDFDQSESLEQNFADAHRLLLVSSSSIDHEERVRRHRNAIGAAVRAQVGHVYYTSLVHADDSAAFVMKAHIETEQILKESGLRYTILRNGIYTEAREIYLGNVSDGQVVIPADGPVAWVSRSDLAEGTARLLQQGGHGGETLQLTGPEALTIGDYARILSGVWRKPLTVRVVSVDEYAAHEEDLGKSVDHAKKWSSTYEAMTRGEFAAVDPFLSSLLGRPLRSVADVVAAAEKEAS